MADVGRAEQVLALTVARYFTGTCYISAETRTRIEAPTAEFGYRPNYAPRNLRTNRGTINVLTAGPLLHGWSSILCGLTEQSAGRGRSAS